MLSNLQPLEETRPGRVENAPAPPGQRRRLKKITARHHMLAIYLASGKTQKHAAMLLGVSPVTVGNLIKDPAFQNLVAEYRDKLVVETELFAAHMQALGLEAVQNLLERIEEEPDSFSNKELHELTKDTADRFGPMKRTHVTVQNEGLGERLERARARAMELAEKIKTVEGTAVEVPAESETPDE